MTVTGGEHGHADRHTHGHTHSHHNKFWGKLSQSVVDICACIMKRRNDAQSSKQANKLLCSSVHSRSVSSTVSSALEVCTSICFSSNYLFLFPRPCAVNKIAT